MEVTTKTTKKVYFKTENDKITELKKEIRNLRSKLYYYKKLMKENVEEECEKPKKKINRTIKDYHLRAKIETPTADLDDNFLLDISNI
jgi:hypothetical protein